MIGNKALRAEEQNCEAQQQKKRVMTNAKKGWIWAICGMYLAFQWQVLNLLKAGLLTFYPLQMNLLNYYEKQRHENIPSGKMICAYLLVEF